MPDRVSIDFETRSAAELKRTGPWVYSQHPSTVALCLAFALGDSADEPVMLWHPTFAPVAPPAHLLALLERWVKKQTGPAETLVAPLWAGRGGRVDTAYVRDLMLAAEENFAGVKASVDYFDLLLSMYEFPEEGRADLERLHARIEGGAEVWAFNAGFERVIWQNVMAARLGWVPVPDSAWRCSAALGATFALPRNLNDASRSLGLPEQKDAAGHALMLSLSKPRKPTKRLPEGGWREERGKLVRLFDYCRQDVRVELAFKSQLRDWPAKELRLWQLDQTINARGVCIDQAMVRGSLDVAAAARAQADEDIRRWTDGAVGGTTKRDELLAWCSSKGVDLPNATKGTLDALLEEPDPDESPVAEVPEERTPEALLRTIEVPQEILRVLRVYRQTNRTSTRKYQAMLSRMSQDGRIRDLLRYHGAATGRWAGQGIQPQNFPRGVFKLKESDFDALATMSWEDLVLLWGEDAIMELLSSALRGALCAGPGNTLTVADFAAIEARGTMWLAGQYDALEIFTKADRKEGPDIYRVQAADIYKVDAGSIPKEDPRRQMGKEAILGLGYEMGKRKFRDRCIANGMDVTKDFARRVVESYRERFYKVPELWRNLEECAMNAIERPSERFRDPEGRTTWGVLGRFLHCRLPSGRLLSYLDPQVSMERRIIEVEDEETGRMVKKDLGLMRTIRYSGINTYTRQWERTSTYGGKLTENVVQALCRDLMADSMLRVEDAGYPIVLTVHDEIVSEHREGFGSLKEFEALVAATEPWAAGLPVSAEGWRGRRYRK